MKTGGASWLAQQVEDALSEASRQQLAELALLEEPADVLFADEQSGSTKTKGLNLHKV